ncbi:MAG TPA: hypothetical protein VFP35_00540 [Candidatus Saccharimonadales bacterium]|nr:hypothetical protein [Candidatus Saccharimonadales bacterium]
MTKADFLRQFPQLVKNYQPTSAVAQQIKQVSLLIIIGASGVGKTSLIQKLDLPFVPSDVTRAPRPGEQEGRDFYFLTDYQQIMADIKAGKFVQIAISPDGEFYASRASAYPPSGWAVLPVVSTAVPAFRALGFAKTLSAFIVPPNWDEWMRRMGSHNLSEDQLSRRLAEARRSFDFALTDPDVHFILNDKLDTATGQLKAMLNGKIDNNREEAAKAIARELLEKIR